MNELQRRHSRPTFPFFDDDFGDVFEGFFRPMPAAGPRGGALRPALDVTEHDDRWVVHAELPGFSREDIEVSLENGRLAIQAEHATERREDDGEGGRALIRERRSGRYVSTLEVGRRVDAEQIRARYENGVLEITLPKLSPETPEGRRITVQ